MNFNEYLTYFKDLLDNTTPVAPYDDEEYQQYTKLNWSRTNRWLKKADIDPGVQERFEQINQPQEWIVITEPWCGDAAQCMPFIHLMAEMNPLITLRIVLRDQPPFLIEEYLTNGSKSIPKLIIRNAEGQDIGVWGPRPAPAQALFEKLQAETEDFEVIKETIQKWYNTDGGKTIQQEIVALLA